MQQHLIELISQAVNKLQQSGEISADLVLPEIQIEKTRDKQFGDYACNIAMLLAKAAGKKPRELAEKVVAQLVQSPQVKQVTIAGPGFINFFLTAAAFFAVIPEILQQGKNFGRSDLGKGERINLEFVSTNPNGPLHVGHGRGAAYGASLANLLETVGYQITREYYVNDAGRQMDIVAVSLWLRYLELFGEKITLPYAAYQGEYVTEIAKELKVKYGDAFISPAADVFKELPEDSAAEKAKEIFIDALVGRVKDLLGKEKYQQIFALGLQSMLSDIRNDLAEFGVEFQNWFHESSLFQNGALKRGLEKLEQGGHLYKQEGATWFRATDFGDEKDRVVIRENGQPTYFASDIAYHWNKFERGFTKAIDVFGSDHHGYTPRIKAFMQAVGIPTEKLTVLLLQFAILYRGKTRVSMSTRGGQFVTLRELRQEVGNDAARFFYIIRKRDQHLDFDLELAKSQSSDNPVYYIQYAHARVCSVLRQLEVKGFQYQQELGLAHLDLLTTAHEQDLIRKINQYPEVIKNAANNYEPHTLAHYLQELAQDFHGYYNSEQFLVADENLRNARLCLIVATQQVIANGLTILGVTAPTTM